MYEMAIKEINNSNPVKWIAGTKNPSILKNGRGALQTAFNQFYGNILTKVCFDAGVFRYGYFVVRV